LVKWAKKAFRGEYSMITTGHPVIIVVIMPVDVIKKAATSPDVRKGTEKEKVCAANTIGR
jgi:hypothetical protein